MRSAAGLAGEIVVVDSGSTDDTVAICRRFTDRVETLPWRGYSRQKQAALDRATQPWVLNLDADERLTDGLREEISALLSGEPRFNGYAIPFRHYFRGRLLRWGGDRGERHVRLFRRNLASYEDAQVHEGIRVESPIGRLRDPIDHFSYRDIAEYLEKCNAYTTTIAARKHAGGLRFHWWHHLRLPYEFVVRYVVKLGFLDGGEGFVYAMLSSYYVWLKFVKIRDMERDSSCCR